MKVSQRIMEVFEEYLKENGYELKIKDIQKIENKVEKIIKKSRVFIQAPTCRFYGKIKALHNSSYDDGFIEIESDDLEEYLETYSME